MKRPHTTCILAAALLACAACDDKSYPPGEDVEEEEIVEDVVEVEDVPEEEADAPDPVPDHPRIWLTPHLVATLEARQELSTPNAVTIREWCMDHGEDDLSGYVDSRGILVLNAINYALLHQIQGSPTYAQRAVEIVEYALDNPYEGTTADTWIELDDFYATRNLVPAVAIVLDWCWDWMGESRRARLVTQLDAWAARIMDSDPRDFEDPSSSSYYGHMWALIAAGYAIWGHHPNAETYIDHARDVMLEEGIKYAQGEEVAWPVWDNTTGRADGGMWNEGTHHGMASTELLVSAIRAVGSAEGIYYTDFDFPDDFVYFNIFATYPGGGRTYAEGDGALGGLDATVRVPVLMAMSLTAGSVLGHGQHWVQTLTTPTTTVRSYKLYNEFIWYDDEVEAVDYTTSFGEQWIARGSQTLLWRDGWGDDALFMAFRIGLLNTDHAHNGLGHFTVYRGGDLVADKALEEGDSTLYEDLHHNVLYIPPHDPTDEGRLYWGSSTIEHYVGNMAYLYLAGDMTGVYTSQPADRNNTVAHKEREFFLVKAQDVLLVMDRGASFDAAHDKVFQLHFGSTPTASGDDHRVSTSSADLIVHTVHPADATASMDVTGTPRLRVATAGSELAKTFLHMLRVTDTGGSLHEIPLAIDTADVVGAAFGSTDGTTDTLVTFSSDHEGDVPAAGSWTLTFDHVGTTAVCYFLDLEPGTTYYEDHVLTGTTLEITISTTDLGSGSSYRASSEGILSFNFVIE